MGKLQARLGRELTLYVRQLAWLAATPKPPEGSKRAQQASSAPKLSRREQMKKDRIVPAMPPNPMPHFTARLIEIGLTESTGVGPAPLSWREINEWQRSSAVTLAPWEAKLIRALSVAYLAESKKAECETCPPPWRAEVTKREIETEEARLRMVLG